MTEIHTLSIFSDGSIQVKVPESGRLAYVKPDWLTERWKNEDGEYDVRPVAPDPGIFPISKTPEEWEQTDFCWYGEDEQWFHVNLLSMQMYGRVFKDLANNTQKQIIINVFLKLTQSDRAYNNNNGTDLKNCYPSVNGQPTIRGEDAKWESLITCGVDNKVRILEQRKVLTGRNAGREFVRIDSFYSGQVFPTVTKELLKDPRIQWAKNVNPKPNPFTPPYLTNFHFGEWTVGLPMPVPILTNGPHWYDLRELQLL